MEQTKNTSIFSKLCEGNVFFVNAFRFKNNREQRIIQQHSVCSHASFLHSFACEECSFDIHLSQLGHEAKNNKQLSWQLSFVSMWQTNISTVFPSFLIQVLSNFEFNGSLLLIFCTWRNFITPIYRISNHINLAYYGLHTWNVSIK